MFQKLCKAQRDWEELVDTELNQEWLSTLSDLRLAGRVSFKRCYAEGLGGNEVKSLQLHCLADASEKAYGAVVYEVRSELLRDTSRSLRVFSATINI